MDESQRKYVSQRRTVDISGPFNRLYYYKRHGLSFPRVQEETSYTIDIMPPSTYKGNDRIINLANKFTHLSSNKVKHVIPAIRWTPEGRRLIVATYNGEFSLWSGTSFNFESLMQAHDSAVTTMEYAHAGDWLVSGDTDGSVKIWQPNFNMVKELETAHTECIRDIAFSPNDSKFVTCSDDNILKVWNFTNGQEEKVLKGHHWDVKSCDWHPTLGCIVSGSKDNLVKFWDPRSGNCVSTLLKFKHTVLKTKFQPTNGNLLLGISKDKSCRVFDIRYHMKELMTIRDEQDYMTLQWHPVNETMFTLGNYDGSMKHFDLAQDVNEPIQTIPYAHDKCITSLAYNYAGNILATASKDRTIRFWTRSKPVDPNAFDDPTYNNHKINGWYFGINNNINSIREKSEFGAAPPALNENGSIINGNGMTPHDIPTMNNMDKGKGVGHYNKRHQYGDSGDKPYNANSKYTNTQYNNTPNNINTQSSNSPLPGLGGSLPGLG